MTILIKSLFPGSHHDVNHNAVWRTSLTLDPTKGETHKDINCGSGDLLRRGAWCGGVQSKVALGALNTGLAERGQKVFQEKCSACHKIGEKNVNMRSELKLGKDILFQQTVRNPALFSAYGRTLLVTPDNFSWFLGHAAEFLTQFAV